jgi:gentisate 1,2-dioxygenase
VHPETAPFGDSASRYGQNMRPMRGTVADRRPANQPLFHYPYATWRKALAELSQSAPIDPHMGHALEFINPANGGPVMPTIAAHVRLIPQGFTTRPRRSSEGMIVVVVEGSGTAAIDGEEIVLSPRDVLAVPSWKAHSFKADQELVLFAYSDKASQMALNLYREENL